MPPQVLKSARSSRGRFRTAILRMIYETEELGITPNVSSVTVANRVEMLTQHDKFLDGPYHVRFPLPILDACLTPFIPFTGQCTTTQSHV